MQVRATAKIRIETRIEIVQTLSLYSEGMQLCINEAWERNIKNNIKLHPFVYRRLKDSGLQSQLAIACIKQSCGMVKNAKTKPIISRCSMRYNFPRSASLKDNILSIATVKGRIKVPFTIPQCYEEYFSWDINESLLRIDGQNRCFFMFTFSKEVDTKVPDLHQVLGIDLGVNNLAVTSEGRFFRSSQVKQVKRRFKHLRAKLQAKGTRASRRLLKKVSGREKRFMAWTNHNISKQIVSSFDCSTIVMENLKGIRRTNRGRRMNYWINNWSFYQLQSFVQYKAERRGINVVRVSPRYTSQLCHKCGKLGVRSSGSFSCLHCGLISYSADLNAARNLAHPKLGERQTVVNQPHLTCNDTKTLSVSVC